MNWIEKVWPFWVTNLKEVWKVIELYETENGVKFYRQSIKHKSFGKSDISHVPHFIRFEDKKSDSQLPTLEYDGIPFIVANTLKMNCIYGPIRKQSQKEKNKTNDDDDHKFSKKRKRVRKSKKLDCPAQITVREIIKFPQFPAASDSEWQRKAASKRVRRALELEEAQGEIRYYIFVPAEHEHKNHLFEKQSVSCQPVVSWLRREVVGNVIAGRDTDIDRMVLEECISIQDSSDGSRESFYTDNEDHTACDEQLSSIKGTAQICRILLHEITRKTYWVSSADVHETLMEKLTDIDKWLSNNIETKEGDCI